MRLLQAFTAPEALARKSEFDPDDPDSPRTQNDGGDRLWAAGQYQQAETACRQAQQRLMLLVAQAPDVVAYRHELVHKAVEPAPAGVKVAPPWAPDFTEFVRAGENRIEVLVCNTLAKHYVTFPTHDRGQTTSGSLGRVALLLSGDR